MSNTENIQFQIIVTTTEGEDVSEFTGTLAQARAAASRALSKVDFFDARGVRIAVNGRSIGRRNQHGAAGWCTSSYGWELGLA